MRKANQSGRLVVRQGENKVEQKIETHRGPLLRGLATNSAEGSLPTIAPVQAVPTSTVHAIFGGARNNIFLQFYGTGNDNATFSALIVGWSYVPGDSDSLSLWVPKKIALLACTLSTAVGVAGTSVLATERFVDTITVTTGYVGTSYYDTSSPADNTPGSFTFDPMGAERIGVYFDMTGATDANCLYRYL